MKAIVKFPTSSLPSTSAAKLVKLVKLDTMSPHLLAIPVALYVFMVVLPEEHLP